MWPPLALSKSLTRVGIDSTNFLHFSKISSSWYQIWIIASTSFLEIVQSVFLNRHLTIAHRFSIGFKSGEFPSQSSTETWFSWKNLTVFLEEWQGAKSCWKIPFSPGNARFKSGKALLLKTSMYLSVFIMPSIGTREPTPFHVKPPQNIFFGGCFTDSFMWWEVNIFPALLRTTWLCLPLTKKWLSSVNITFFHWSTVQDLYFFAHWSRFFFILFVRSCFFTGLMAFIPAMTSRFLTVLELICVPECARSLWRSKLVFLRSNLLCLIKNMSSLGDVFRFLPHFPFLCGDPDPVLATCFSNLETVDWFTAKRLAISLWLSCVLFHRLIIEALFLGVISDIIWLLRQEDKKHVLTLACSSEKRHMAWLMKKNSKLWRHKWYDITM